MRLLNCRTQVLEDVVAAPPPYAILSHTWEEEEVVFNDLRDTNVEHTASKGWYKIDRTCKQALQDGLHYVWVDTLCIDKSSSAELSEAINSMFKWYRDSTVCYAYLCDLPSKSLESSRWFTRGWTLQEMIAPKKLEFYDRDWKPIGTKTSLVDQLHQITGVDRAILTGGNLWLMSVAKKMSWAAKRETTRVEDMAYCLLGLFDISMPMLYGEGHKAFIRLQEEIVKEYDDHSLFAWRSTTAGSQVGLFARSPADFIDSGNVVPCGGRRIEPTTVTSRGLRITAVLTKPEGRNLDGTTILAALSCRRVDLHMGPWKRIALVVKKCSGNVHSDYTGAYIRLRPDELFSVQANSTERASLYFIKNNNLGDLIESHVFWVRTMPIWLQDRPFQLALVHPHEQWDGENGLFRVDMRRSTSIIQFLLVFRQDYSDGEPTGYFLVFLGVSTQDQDKAANSIEQKTVRLWCHTQFRRGLGPEALNLDHPVETVNQHSSHWAQGAGVMLKCYTSMAMVSGQELHCADLQVKMLEEAGSTPVP